jgi:succinate dehydrogenase / fumarate reductase, cytochrome b subunit
MNPLTRLYSSSIGLKLVMALTGAFMTFFIIVHMVGNLESFGGQEALNHYAKLLRTLPPALWAFRALLALSAVLHIVAGVRLWVLNRQARPVGYAKLKTQETTLAARTMLYSGLFIGGFVTYHLLHFTFRTVDPSFKEMLDERGWHDVYGMVGKAFSSRGQAGFYFVMMLLLGLHVSHGVASMLHTLGINHPRYSPAIRWLGPVVAVLIVMGFVSVPFAILAGFLQPAGGM